MNNDIIVLISDLVRKCIGDRSLDQACKDTGLSKNMLHRLRNGDFLRIPKESVVLALTDEKANPQNGITYDDFNKIAKYNNGNNRTDTTQNNMELIHSQVTLIKGIVINWLLEQHEEIVIKKDADKFDLVASIGDEIYLFDIKLIVSNSVLHRYPKDRINKTILNIASSTFITGISYIIVTNDKYFFEELKKTPINIASKVRVMLVDTENEFVDKVVELN